MARKKKEPELKKNIDTAHVEGLRAEVLEQPITDTLTGELYALCDERHRLARHPGDRRLQAVTPQAAIHDVQNGPAERRAAQNRANIVGQTMRLNPHGDAAIYETMVRLARGQRGAAAPRLSTQRATSARSIPAIWPTPPRAIPRPSSTPICAELFRDIDSETVDFVDNYDNTMKEPALLPTTYPERSRHRPTWASPSAWPATSAASTSARSATPRSRGSEIRTATCCSVMPAPDFSTGGELLYDARGNGGNLPHRPRQRHACAPAGAITKEGQSASRSTRSPIPRRRRPSSTRSPNSSRRAKSARSPTCATRPTCPA